MMTTIWNTATIAFAVSFFVVVATLNRTNGSRITTTRTSVARTTSPTETRSKIIHYSLLDNNNNNVGRILQSSTSIRSKIGHIIGEAFDSTTPFENEVHQLDIHGNDTIETTAIVSSITDVADNVNETENALIEAMVQQLAPKEFRYTDAFNTTIVRHQFLHLHHMKTGGTSMDRLIRCAKDRYVAATSKKVNTYSIHECSESSYQQCVSGQNKNCQSSIYNASVLSYCAPLKDLQNPFGWTEVEPDNPNKIHAITVFRHPVARAWSMYRYSTKRCYGCRPLKDVYALMDQDSSAITEMCKHQLSNHLTRNVLSNESITDDNLKVQNAIENMKSFFTMVGLTEDMNATATMAGMVFPWLAETIPGSTTVCKIEHANASPQNNMCGPDNTHLPIPDTPDDETAEIIRQHNQLDMILYDAAVEQFRIQKLALRI